MHSIALRSHPTGNEIRLTSTSPMIVEQTKMVSGKNPESTKRVLPTNPSFALRKSQVSVKNYPQKTLDLKPAKDI